MILGDLLGQISLQLRHDSTTSSSRPLCRRRALRDKGAARRGSSGRLRGDHLGVYGVCTMSARMLVLIDGLLAIVRAQTR